MGFTNKLRMRKHWSASPLHNCPPLRECMQRDFFELLYCRFLHCSDGNAPPRWEDEGENIPNPNFDSKWHIRWLNTCHFVSLPLFPSWVPGV
ncbi:unnamed protein product [Pylaiella littoralis]